MSLLDFLGGVAGAGTRVLDDMDRRDAEERRRQEIEAERRRLADEAERVYQRNRSDALTDRADQRKYLEDREAAERERLLRESARKTAAQEQGILGLVAGRNDASPEQVDRLRKGGLLDPQQGPWEEGLVAEADPAKAKKVFAEVNRLLSGAQAGVPVDKSLSTMKDEDEAARFDAMTPEQQRAFIDRKQALAGRTPESMKQDSALERIAARGDNALAAIAARLANSGGNTERRGDDAQFRVLVSTYQNLYNKADAAVNKAAASVDKQVLSKDKDAARSQLKTAEAARAAAKRDLDYVLRTGAMPPSDDEAGPKLQPFAPAAASAPAPAAQAKPPSAIDMAKANEIKKAFASGRLTRAEATQQLRALGFQ